MQEPSGSKLTNALSKSKDRALRPFVDVKPKDRVIIKHINEAEEVFANASVKDGSVLIDCTWYVDASLVCQLLLNHVHSVVPLECDKTKLYIDRSGRSKRTDQLHSVALSIPMNYEGRSSDLNNGGKNDTAL